MNIDAPGPHTPSTVISNAYHEGINGVYLLTKYGPKI